MLKIILLTFIFSNYNFCLNTSLESKNIISFIKQTPIIINNKINNKKLVDNIIKDAVFYLTFLSVYFKLIYQIRLRSLVLLIIKTLKKYENYIKKIDLINKNKNKSFVSKIQCEQLGYM